MNKRILSYIIIITTAISVITMIYYDNKITKEIDGFWKIDLGEEETKVHNSKDDSINSKVSVNKYIDDKYIKEDGNLDKKNNEEIYIDDDSVKENVEVRAKEIDEQQNEYEYYIKEEKAVHTFNNNTTDKSYNNTKKSEVTVFKVNKAIIPSKISNKDKIKMLKMANSLSLSDYKILSEHIKRNDELPAATDIFSILKNKLSEKDYKELKKILNPYIDITLIEKNINNKK